MNVARAAETVIAAGAAAVLTMIYLILVGRALGPADYADFAAALSVMYFCGVALTPVTPTIARVVASLSVRGEHDSIAVLRRGALRVTAIATGIAAIVAIAVSPLIARWLHLRSTVTIVLAIVAAVLFALLSVDRGVLHGAMRFRTYNVSVVAEAAVRCLGAVILLWLAGASAPVALISYVVSHAVGELVILPRLPRGAPRDAEPDWTPIATLAKPMFALMIAVALTQNADMLAVKHWFAAHDSGLYGAASALARSFGVVFVPLYVMAGPLLTARHEAQQPVVALAVRFTLTFLALAAIPLVVLIVAPEPVMRILYGDAFTGAAPLVAPLAGVIVLMYCALMLVQALITRGDFRFLRIYAAGAIVLVGGLAFFHANFRDIVAVLYASQVVVLAGVAFLITRSRA